MKYILKNLKSFAKDYTGIFIIVLLCQLVSVLLMFFSFGVYQNFLNETNDAVNGSSLDESEYVGYKCFQVKNELPPDTEVYPAQLSKFYEEVVDVLGGKVEVILTECEHNISLNMEYSNGKLVFPYEFESNTRKYFNWDYGRSFTDEEFINGEKVCMAPSGCCKEYFDPNIHARYDENTEEDVPYDYPYEAYKSGDKWYVNIEGTEYECIAFFDAFDQYYIPQRNMPDSINLIRLPSVELKYQLTVEENSKMQKLYNRYFPGMIEEFYELTLIDNEKIYYNNTNMWISVLIAIVSAINLALIMNYILTRRRKSLAIFRINGCSANKARRIYVAEILLILNIVFAVCLLLWIIFLLPLLGKIFEYIEGAFSFKVYGLIYLCYILISYFFMNVITVKYLRNQPIDLLKRR